MSPCAVQMKRIDLALDSVWWLLSMMMMMLDTKPRLLFMVAKLSIQIERSRRANEIIVRITMFFSVWIDVMYGLFMLTLLLLLQWFKYLLWNGWRCWQVFTDRLEAILIGDITYRIQRSIWCCITPATSLHNHVSLFIFTSLCTIVEQPGSDYSFMKTRTLLSNSVRRFKTIKMKIAFNFPQFSHKNMGHSPTRKQNAATHVELKPPSGKFSSDCESMATGVLLFSNGWICTCWYCRYCGAATIASQKMLTNRTNAIERNDAIIFVAEKKRENRFILLWDFTLCTALFLETQILGEQRSKRRQYWSGWW